MVLRRGYVKLNTHALHTQSTHTLMTLGFIWPSGPYQEPWQGFVRIAHMFLWKPEPGSPARCSAGGAKANMGGREETSGVVGNVCPPLAPSAVC